MKEYRAIYGIDGGVSSGFGQKVPDYIEKSETISAENPQIAYREAMKIAEKFADDHLSNPETGLTSVQVIILTGHDGDVSFDASKAIVNRSTLEHILSLFPKLSKKT